VHIRFTGCFCLSARMVLLFSLSSSTTGLSIFFRVLGASLCFCFALFFAPSERPILRAVGPLSLPLLKNSRKNLFRGFIHPLCEKSKKFNPHFPSLRTHLSTQRRAEKRERGGAYFFVSSLRIVKTRHRLQREAERRGLLFLNREREW